MDPIDRPGFDHFVVAIIAVNEGRFYECVATIVSTGDRARCTSAADRPSPQHRIFERCNPRRLSVPLNLLQFCRAFVSQPQPARTLGAVKIRSYENQLFADIFPNIKRESL